MYTPPYFQINDRALLFSIMAEFSFAVLVSGQGSELVASHLPLLAQDDGSEGRILGHMARANTQWRCFDGETEALAIFQGSHGYISPAWYDVSPSVPTWNYTAVHAYGVPRIIEDHDEVVEILRQTVEKYESGRNTPWEMDLPPDYMMKMVKGIVAFEMTLQRIEGKAKLSQNRSPEDRLRVIQALEASALWEERQLAQTMRESERRLTAARPSP